jgi:hypothetical protein
VSAPWATRTSGRAAALLLSSLLLVSCGGAGDGEGGEPPVSPTRTPTTTLTIPSPEPTSPEATSPEASSPEASRPELPSPTRTPGRTGSEDQSATTPSPEQTEEPDPPETSSPTSAGTGQSGEGAAEEPPDEDGVPSWVWWLAGAVLVACAIAVPLVRRARRRSTWTGGLEDAEREVAWLARDLLPTLRSARSREESAGGWAVSETRVAAAEDRLVVLESSAHDETGRMRARMLRDAVRRARARIQALVGPGAGGNWVRDIDAVIADLELALDPTAVGSAQ